MHRHTTHCTRGMTIEERLLHFLPERPEGQCWIWTGAQLTSGYPVFGMNRRQYRAHRVAYETWVGPIPEELTIDHVRERGCTSRLCCNPDHLEAVSAVENVMRGTAPPVLMSQWESCAHGHEFDEVRWANGKPYRGCSTCRRERGRRYDAKRRARYHEP